MYRRSILFLFVIGLISGCVERDAPLPNTTFTAFNADALPTVEFSVPDMMCPEGCGVAVDGILSKQPGAKDVLVDFENKKAIVAIEPGRFDSDKALAALVDKQFLKSSVVVESREKQAAEEVEAEGAKPQAADGAGQ